MCRHLAYLGTRRSLSSLVLEPPHSLARQSWSPADMRGGGTVNVDGFGLGWYAGDAEPGAAALGPPVRYRRTGPIWADPDLPALAAATAVTTAVAAVRAATPGMPTGVAACAPFTGEHWMFSHNGVVRGWPDSMADLAKELPITELLTLEAATDAALVWAVLRQRLAAGRDPATALADLVCELERAAPASRLNLLLTDGHTLYATAWGHSLSVLDADADGGVVVASEPWDDDPRWIGVPDRTLLVAAPGDVRTHSMRGAAWPT